ncbi:hypothetical protein [Candidatus Pelagadaptatus aseana]|uniref:hypothetical protein n=1 Tax=Candidatus Pelagadaptatus aseana TaxID=3120508 RepID=UPI003C6F39F6
MPIATVRSSLLLAALSLLLSACSSTTVVKTTQPIAIEQQQTAIAEAELLDVGIKLFDPNLEQLDRDDETLTFAEIRNAESRFLPMQLMSSLQASAAWGAVRVVPITQNSSDVTVSGKILHSDGEQLSLEISVSDATGRHWFTRDYEERASKYAYRKTRPGTPVIEPFQNLYHRIANDMLQYRRDNFDGNALRGIRTTGELRFAQEFSPAAFGGHVRNSNGKYTIQRLPANNDPMMQRIRMIRERDYLFIDTMQGYYDNFTQEMYDPYQEWRGMSYKEAVAMRKLKSQARTDTIMGIAAIIAGIAGAASDSSAARASSGVAIAGGGFLIKSGYDKRAEAEMHLEALMELGESLEAEMEPQVIELEDRTITLSGTVDNQYKQWRELLKDLYDVETGS